MPDSTLELHDGHIDSDGRVDVRKKISVVIANWNGKQFLPRCLASLRVQTHSPHEILVVDNGSADGSVQYLRDSWPDVTIIENAWNVGFAEANNIGIRRAEGDYIATLNNDAWADPAWLQSMVKVAHQDSRVGMVASTMLFANNPEIIASAGIDLYKNGLATDRLLGQPMSSLADESAREVFGPSAGAALYDSAMLGQVGLFDPKYFAYLEDVDLAWRARLHGWRCLHAPQAIVYHIYSGTGGQDSTFKNYHLARNRLWTIAANMPSGTIRRNLVHILLYEALALGYGLAFRDRGLLCGRAAALRSLPDLLEKRRRVQESKTISDEDLERLMKPVRNPVGVFRQKRSLRALLDMPSKV